ISGAFRMLGFRPWLTFLLFFLSLVGSVVNIPVYSFKIKSPVRKPRGGLLTDLLYPRRSLSYRERRSTIAVNLGGAVIPVLISVYLIAENPHLAWQYLVGTGIVTVICYRLARPVPGVGISMPLLIPPIAAAIVAIFLPGSPTQAIAYVSGVNGVIIGADLLNLKKTIGLGSTTLSIGGAGTFDGIFLTGIVAVFLTA
ncbi:MAG: DUF1614 domain-containing protein, partial [Thermoplasmata archaeon]